MWVNGVNVLNVANGLNVVNGLNCHIDHIHPIGHIHAHSYVFWCFFFAAGKRMLFRISR